MKREFKVVYTPIEDGWVMARFRSCRGPLLRGGIWRKRER